LPKVALGLVSPKRLKMTLLTADATLQTTLRVSLSATPDVVIQTLFAMTLSDARMTREAATTKNAHASQMVSPLTP